MLNSLDFSGKPFHFIGIGGIGMSALAYVLAKRHLPVYGSDVSSNHITQRLREVGVHIFWGQDASNLEIFQQNQDEAGENGLPTTASEDNPEGLKGGGRPLAIAPKAPAQCLPQVICSTAIHPNNAEYKAALALGFPIFHRSDLLAAMMRDYSTSIAVAGTHGKTTTSSLLGYVLLHAEVDPTIIVGGEVKAWEGNARLGQSSFLVVEADESDGSLVKLAANIGVVTNIELDHPDHYQSLEQVIDTFQTFATQCDTLVGCADCDLVRDRLNPTITYSLRADSGADYTVDRITYTASGTIACVWERGTLLGELRVRLLGRHNLSNALAVVAVARHAGVSFDRIQAAIATFEGARRRFEIRGEYEGILFVDDYAHHPSEVEVTLAAARLRVQASSANQPPGRLVAIFQPHRYSRIRALFEEFARSFADADVVVVSDIYAAGEANPDGWSGDRVAEAIAAHHPCVVYQPTLEAIAAYLKQALMPGDLALFLGAGNLNRIIPEVMDAYRNKAYEQAS